MIGWLVPFYVKFLEGDRLETGEILLDSNSSEHSGPPQAITN